MARMLYLSSILLHKRKHKNDIQQGNSHGVLRSRREIAKMYTNISKSQLKQVDGIYDGKAKQAVDFWGEVLIAFQVTMKAVQSDPCWSRNYERMHTIVMKLKCRYYSRSTDSCDSQFDYRAEFSNFLNKNTSVLSQEINFLNELDELYDSIELCRKISKDKSDSQLPLQSTISSKASTLFRESLKLVQLGYVQCGSDLHIMHGDLELLMTQGTVIFEISVRLAMISSNYSFPKKSTEEVFYSALNKLEEIVSWIKELSSVRHTEVKVTEMSLPMSSTQS